MQGFEKSGTNLLVVFVTDEHFDRETILEMQSDISRISVEGGLMIIRYRETYKDGFWHKSRDQIAKAFDRIKSCIA